MTKPAAPRRLSVMTTEEEGNDFDGEVWAMLYGQDGATSEIKLTNPTVRPGRGRRGMTKSHGDTGVRAWGHD